MKLSTLIIGTMAALVCATAQAGDFILSRDLKLDYREPVLLGHSQDYIHFKYEDWSFVHELVNPKTVYPSVDLTGVEVEYLTAVFEPDQESTLPVWLAALAQEQAKAFGIHPESVDRKKIGDAKLLGFYNKDENKAFVYVFDGRLIHNFVVKGPEKRYRELINSIKER